MMDTAYARNLTVERQLQRRGVRDSYVLEAMRSVPREVFVAETMREFAYEDSPLPIAAGQTISQPYIVGFMLEAAALHPGDRVLEIGAGSGYAAAVMSRIAGKVFAIERHDELTRAAQRRFERLGYENIELKTGDGTNGWAEQAPFDAILVAAGGPSIPRVLMEQLDIGGRLVIPVGAEERSQRLVKVTRTNATHWDEEDLGAVQFVPLIGEYGWGSREGPLSRAASARRFERRGSPR